MIRKLYGITIIHDDYEDTHCVALKNLYTTEEKAKEEKNKIKTDINYLISLCYWLLNSDLEKLQSMNDIENYGFNIEITEYTIEK